MSIDSESDDYEQLDFLQDSKSKIFIRWTSQEIDTLVNSRLKHNQYFVNKGKAHIGWKLVYQDLQNAGVSEKITFHLMKKKWTALCTRYRDCKNRGEDKKTDWVYFQILDELYKPLIKEGKTKLKLKDIKSKIPKNLNDSTQTDDVKPVLSTAEMVINHYLSLKKDNVDEKKPLYFLFTPKTDESTKENTDDANNKNLNEPLLIVVNNQQGDVKPINTKCRLCQEEDGTQSLIDNDELRSRIEACTSLKIEINELLPSSVCNYCEYVINTFHKFLMKCQRNDQQLREIASKINSNVCSSLATNNEEKKFEIETEFEGSPEYLLEEFDVTSEEIKTEILENEDQVIHIDYAEDIKQEKDENEIVIKELELKNGSLTCQICTKQFLSSSLLKKHYQCHTGRKFPCLRPDCKKKYSTLPALRQHDRLAHLGILGKYMCAICGRHCVSKSALRNHESIHRTKSIKCTGCNRKFSNINSMKLHRAHHHEGNKYYCSKCPKSFLSKMSLDRHELVHTGIKEFSCDMCPMQFYTEKELIRHIRLHKGIKNHRCPVCFKAYVEKYSLIRHMASHNDEKPYACTEEGCNKAYKNKQKLKNHMKKNHNVDLPVRSNINE